MIFATAMRRQTSIYRRLIPGASGNNAAISDSSGSGGVSQTPVKENHVLPVYESHVAHHHYYFQSLLASQLKDQTKSQSWLEWLESWADDSRQPVSSISPPVEHDPSGNETNGGNAPTWRDTISNWLPWTRQSDAIPLKSRLNYHPKNIVIIGIHGWFPQARIVQQVFGEPVGTSGKFCEMMEAALKDRLKPDDGMRIQSIPLTGNGKIQDRVDDFFATLQEPPNRSLLESADTVMVVTHSQGTLVSTMLLAKLIRECQIDPNRQRVGALCMAGIAHGPFTWLKGNLVIQYVEADAARELFDFCHVPDEVAESDPSAAGIFRRDIEFICESGVKIVPVASWMDQVVPLYSALMTAYSHPNIYRAVYIDHHNHDAGFLTDLVCFLVQLRNYGLSDNGLLLHLSEILTGSLYSGVEHSTIYEEPKVYELFAQWTLEDQIRPNALALQRSLPFRAEEITITPKLNPYQIPWAMHAIFSDERIQRHPRLRDQLSSLVRLYQAWQPSARPMKDLKYRLEPLRSRL